MNQPKVSVIIPVYNTEKYLRECLDSVVNQTLRDIEIVCVDDGSTDSSPEILHEYAAKDSRVKVYTQEKSNAGAARNVGLSKATGEYLAFLDSDDYYVQTAMDHLYACAKGRNAEIVVYQVLTFIEDSNKPPFPDSRYDKSLLPDKEVFSFGEIEKNAFVAIRTNVWDKLIKRELVVENHLRFQSLDAVNDLYFSYISLLSASSITVLEEPLIYCRRRSSRNSITDTRYLHIDCAYSALQCLKDYLVRNALYEHYERDFINVSILILKNNYYTVMRNPNFKKQLKVKECEWLEEFHVNDHPLSYYYNLSEYEKLLQAVLTRRSVQEAYQKNNRAASAEKQITIPVVYATDQAYIRYTLVSMVSALQNARRNTFYAFIVLIPPNSGIDQTDIDERLSRFNNYSLSFIEMGNEFADLQMHIPQITSPNFYRLRIASLLENLDKCIYLDGDTIVCEDLQSLYTIDLLDNYLGGVPAYGYYKTEVEHRKRLELNDNQEFLYIKAGVLLMNLRKLRDDKKENQFITLLDKDCAFQDQDILNMACYGKIQLLPYRYNIMTKYAEWNLKDFPSEAIPCEIISGRMYPAIIHYADKTKPWKDYSSPYSSYWFSAAMTDICWDLFSDIPILKKRQTVKEDAVPNVKNISRETYKSLSRKLRGGVQCYRDHGAGYTVRRALYHMGLWKDEENPGSYRSSKSNLRVPDKLSGGVQCYRDHGLDYTLRRTLYHMGLWKDEEAPRGPENRPKLVKHAERIFHPRKGK